MGPYLLYTRVYRSGWGYPKLHVYRDVLYAWTEAVLRLLPSGGKGKGMGWGRSPFGSESQ